MPATSSPHSHAKPEGASAPRTGADTGSEGKRDRLLIVDDDPEIVLALETYFKEAGYEVEAARDGGTALELMAREPGFELVLLDVTLPVMTGFEVLEKSHELGLTSPVLMMSGRGDQEDILKGFGLGAQDYIVKPFEADELRERTDALAGRHARSSELPSRHQIGRRTVDLVAGTISWDDVRHQIAEMELDVLRCLVRNVGCVVTKRRLLREAWHIDGDLIAHSIDPDIAVKRIDRAVLSLRRKLEPVPTKPRFIVTVYGLGYRLFDKPRRRV